MNLHLLKIIFLCFVALSVGCSSSGRYRVLSFFFDGVPEPAGANSAATDSLAADSTVAPDAEKRSQPAAAQYFYHAVYEEKSCESCHDPDNGNQLMEDQPDLCYQCHEDFSEKYSVLHAPVEGGECTSCHNPHLAKNKFLLVRQGQALCFECHFSEDIMETETHQDLGETDCTECHNPHGGEDEQLFN
jgi:predicted CXXCH cytochrome family protein